MEAKARATDIPPAETRRAAFAHAVPYLVWIAFILVLFVAPRLGIVRAASWAAPAYAPESVGWGMAVAKLRGSAFVISAAEEYFFRGFLYRWLRNARFLSLPVGAYDATAFWTVVAVFGLEHDRWLLGMVAGMAYGWLVLRTGRILPAVIAHALTNLLLGLHVLLSHQYGFW